MFDAVLFDLDGTLADTAPDLGRCLNAVRAEQGLAPVALAQLRPHTSSGVRGLLRAGMDVRPDHPEYATLAQRFLVHYAAGLCVDTQPYDGMESVLTQIEARGLPWGIVTNKAARFTEPLVVALAWHCRASCVVSGDTTPHAKPHPAPLLHAAQALKVAPEHCVYIGDDLRDIQAARAAGMASIAAAWGYLGETHAIHDWGADCVLDTPAALPAALGL
ncbi:MAG: phosphoglycolate phosphatase [Rhodocyclaceae bacterium]|nr:phosphoglycolate phosphatase [Rhodocyclaceae bacterium]